MIKDRRGIMAGVVLALACQGAALAQQAPAPAETAPAAQAPAAPVPAAPAAPTTAPVPELPAPEPPASQLAAARELVISSGMSRSFEPMVPELAQQIAPMLTRTRPDLTADLAEVLKQLQPEFEQKGQEMIDVAAHIYARRMSEDELKQAADFFNSPVGKKYVTVQPGMLDELVVAMQSWTQQLSTFMMTRVRQEMTKKGHQF